MVLPDVVLSAASDVLVALEAARLRVVTAESCTGGLVAGALTHQAGSSAAVSGGFVTYSNAMKQTCLGVPEAMLVQWGAVSEAVALAMAFGALQAADDADVSVAITGIAGPDGGSAEKPVGLVWFAVMRRGREARAERRMFAGGRIAVRAQAVGHALGMVLGEV
ncbi:nicotinamide-nucleotide amidohydrolase family protein [Acetobacter sp. LMG 1636]|uniref:Nicotinamide-nucleotide amidohydrolase family protein n=2 Tax=Acetobacter fallax TaxID=1737473 RepID=A0ABX0K790_9PROT|nr:nicotinamide-nucleotide amidohydrolase family protein [Acetobacter fallax]NHO35334.1 nicotinamide-nucleotide amidohydrolase family protein [Acetobacter fallax]